MRFLYNSSIRLYYSAILLASVFDEKAKKWINGRKKLFDEIDKVEGKSIWIHAASLGEFEQGRPIIEKLRKKYPEKHIHLSFFSPSGYEIRKDYNIVDSISYLPLDTAANAQKMIKKLNPEVVVIIKYEYWYNLISELKKANVNIVLASAIFRESQLFFKNYGTWFRKQLQNIDMFFTQDDKSTELLKSIGVKNVKTAGDTRFDRVAEIASKPESFEQVSRFSNNQKIILAGSTWTKDEENILKAYKSINSDAKLIIAPHNVDDKHISNLVQLFSEYNPQLFSKTNSESIINSKVLIIDSIGILMHLYQYADFAYIGGGFGAGIHNILEAATYGKAVVFGPNYKKFNEACDLIKLKTAFNYNKSSELEIIFNKLLLNESLIDEISTISKSYIKEKTGAVDLITKFLQTKINK